MEKKLTKKKAEANAVKAYLALRKSEAALQNAYADLVGVVVGTLPDNVAQ